MLPCFVQPGGDRATALAKQSKPGQNIHRATKKGHVPANIEKQRDWELWI